MRSPACCSSGHRGVAGGGYAQLSQALNGSLPVKTLLVLGVLKFGATLLSYSSGGAGGLFAPALFIGAMLGGSVGWLGEQTLGYHELGEFALVGMGAVFDGIHLLHAPATPGQLDGLRVAQAMTKDVISLPSERTAEAALTRIEHQPFTAYPVVNGAQCLGLINPARLRRVIAEGGDSTPITELVRLREYVYPEDSLIRAVVRMNALGTRQLPVVKKDVHYLRGMIPMSDIFRTQAHAAAETEPVDSLRAPLGE